MRGVVKAGETGQARRLGEGVQQVVGVGIQRLGADIGALPLLREFQPLAGTGQERAVEQPVVLKEAEEHDAEDPVHRRLVDRRGPERFERVGGAFRVERRAPLGLHRVALRGGGVLFAQVG